MIASLRKADFLLFFFFLAVAAIVAAAPLFHSAGGEQKVRIISGRETVGVYPLDKDTEIEISHDGHINIISVQDRKVCMKYSDCRNQVCVHTGEISRPGETIVCLPNYVIVEIFGSKEGGGEDNAVDVIAK